MSVILKPKYKLGDVVVVDIGLKEEKIEQAVIEMGRCYLVDGKYQWVYSLMTRCLENETDDDVKVGVREEEVIYKL